MYNQDDMEAKEEIRSKLAIEDVIGEYVQLRRAGRNFKGISPFTQEKTASFMVSPDKHIWHDFSANKGGDIFSFVMEVEGIDFRSALELLARRAGVDLSLYSGSADRELAQKKARLYTLLDLVARFYQRSLLANRHALEYVFAKRAISKPVALQFRIGYAPNSGDDLVQFLKRRGYPEGDMLDAGVATNRRGRLYDLFRGRMMVPLADREGRIVGFTARLIQDEPNAPKYINTPQTLLYDKGRQVFGLHLAKEAIRQNGYAVIVEGNLDVVASHQAGVAQVVATAGTAMTEDHLRSLGRLTADIRLAFDQDKAGINATERAIGIASKLGLQLRIVSVPDGYKDPDELIKADPARWAEVVDQPQDAILWLLDTYAQRFDLSTAEGKRRTSSKALEIIGQLIDPVEQEHYLKVLSERLDTSLTAVRAKLTQTATPSRPSLKQPHIQPSQPTPDIYQHEDHLLGLALVYPNLRDALLKLEARDFTGGLRQTVFALIKKLGNRLLDDTLLERLQSDELCVKIKELQLIVEHKYEQADDTLYFVASELSKRVLRRTKTKQKDALARELEVTSNPDERQTKNEQYKQLIRDIENLKH